MTDELTERNVTKLNSWHEIDWQKVNTSVKRLRQRIFVASRAGDLKRVKNLQKLMLRSRANWLISIRQVTQINRGRRTPGVDRQIVTTPAERLDLFYWLETMTLNEWQPLPTRRVEIPKGNGKTRPLGISTIKDRVIQTIVKNALEPEWEAKFEPSSYGFRPGRCTHDAIEDIWATTNKGKKLWVLDADIKGAFDNLSQDFLQEAIGHFPAKPLIEKWLKAGIMIGLDLTPTDAGTPQGGPISPLLMNVALHGMEEALGIKADSQGYYSGPRKVVRYADDLVVLTRTKEDAEASKAELTEWLAVRGLCLSEEKTSITHLDDGIDFLGFNIKKYKAVQKKRGYSIYTKPSKKSIKKFKTKVYEIVKRRISSTPRETLAELNPLIRGWGIYYRSGVSAKVFNQLDSYIWGRTWHCYTKRRHPNKGKKWRKQKYYKVVRGYDWTFYDKESGVNIHRLAHIPIVRHIKVKRDASPDDPALQEYWQLRQRRPKELSREKASLWVRQKGLCPICEQWLDNEEELHTHHTRGREVEDLKYKQLLHETCHHQVTINGTA